MDVSELKIEALNSQANRNTFDSTSEPLNRYLQKQASQDVKRRVATCFTLVTENGGVIGYYTLAATGVALSDLPDAVCKKLPRYPMVPAVLMGRLAVDRRYGGQGFGALLVADALKRIARSDIAVYALIVDAKDDAAVGFYRNFGFIPFDDKPYKLFFPIGG